MTHTFFCEQCRKRFDVDEAMIGKHARCKECKHVFVIPGLKLAPGERTPFRLNPALSPSPEQYSDPSPGYDVLPERLGKPVATVRRKKRVIPITALILGIFGLVAWLLPFLGIPIAITGLVLGRKADQGPYRGVASAAVILCGISLALSALNMAAGMYLALTGQHAFVNAIGLGPKPKAFPAMVPARQAGGVGAERPAVPAASEGDAGADPAFEEFVKEFIAARTGMNDVLARIKSPADASNEAERYTAVAHRFQQLGERFGTMNRPDPAEDGRLREVYGPSLERAEQRYLEEVERVARIEGARATLALDSFLFNKPILNRMMLGALAKRNANPARWPTNVEQATKEWAAERTAGKVANLPAAKGLVTRVTPPARAPNPARERDPVPTRDGAATPAPPRAGAFRRRPPTVTPQEPLTGSSATIAELLGTPQSARAMAALKAMGSAAEAAVIPHLRSDNWFARKDACRVLKVIGTEKCVSELRVIAENNGLSTGDAREALFEIARRGHSPDPPTAEPSGAQRGDP